MKILSLIRRFLFEACFYLVMFSGVAFTFLTIGPWVESAVFPVVSKLVITARHDNGDGTTTIYAYFRKLRDCDFVGISWYRGRQDGEFERVPVQLIRKPGDISSPNRPVGAQRSGPWIIGVPIGEVDTNSFAELTHHCHFLWPTKTRFYP